MLNIECVISGGQTGVDRAALDWAIAQQIPHGGWCPLGRIDEDGVIDAKYMLTEISSPKYVIRTKKNITDSDGTLVLNVGELDGGTAMTERHARNISKPCLVVQLDSSDVDAHAAVKRWLAEYQIKRLNVAGPRESKRPGVHFTALTWLNGLN